MRTLVFLTLLIFSLRAEVGFGALPENFAQQVDTAWQAQQQQDYAAAAQQYEKIIDGGVRNAAVFYNLAHAHYRLGRIGEAVAALLAARALRPRDPDIQANLEFLRSKLRDDLVYEVTRSWLDQLLGWTAYLSRRELVVSWAVFSLIILLTLLGILLFEKARVLRSAVYVGLTVSILLLPAVIYRSWWAPSWGAVMVDATEVYSGPGASGFVALFKLHAGAPCVILQGADGWYKIQLSDGKKGWVASSALRSYQQIRVI